MADDRRRLVVVTSTYPRRFDDEEPRFTHDLARHLLPFYDVTVLCPRSPGASERDSLDGVEIVRYGYAPRRFETLVNNGGIVGNLKRSPWKLFLVPSFVLCGALRLRSLLSASRTSVVHAHWLIPGGVIAAISARSVPFVVTAHGSDVFALRGRLMKTIKAWVIRKASGVTVVSAPMANQLVEDGIRSDQLSVLPMGIDVAEFFPDTQVLRDPNQILFVGRLVRIKGCDVLLKAFAQLVRSQPSLRLLIVGDGPERSSLTALASQLGIDDRVTFHGARPHADLGLLYRSSALTVWPSIRLPSGQQEGLGMVVAEAAACGCPVLVSDQPAMRWLLEGLDGVFFRQGDVEALAEAMQGRLVSTGEGKPLDTAVTKLVTRKLDWNHVSESYAQVFGGVINDRA